jgi:hypothetical protein
LQRTPEGGGTSDAWAVGYYRIQRYTFYPLALQWNGTSWAIGSSPDVGSNSVLTSVSTAPGDAIVQAVGYDGTQGSWNPLAMQNG